MGLVMEQMNVTIRYFALFREQAGREMETAVYDRGEITAREVYADVKERNGFSLESAYVRPAINGAYVSWDTPLSSGDEVVFIPPVSGG